MNDSDLQRIEKELGIKLPDEYRSVMTEYPFAADSESAEFLLPDTPAALIELAGGRENLPPNSFLIGSDGSEEYYFIDLSRTSSPVYVFQVETGKIGEEARSLTEYVQKCRDIEAEIHRDEEDRARKKWWQFWR